MLFDPKWEEKIVVKEEPWRQELRNAANVIKQRGWIQHRLTDKQGRVCAIGAISSVSCISHINYTAQRKLSEYLTRNAGKHQSIVEWNDAPGRTKEEVVQAMLHVADE